MRKQFKIKPPFIAGIIVGVLVCWLLAVGRTLFILLPIVLLSVYYWRKESGVRWWRWNFFEGFLVGTISRIIIIGSLSAAILNVDSVMRGMKQFGDSHSVLFMIVLGMDIDAFEHAFIFKRESVAEMLETGAYKNSVDPFSGAPFALTREGVPYSFGPDCEDNGGLVIYDPVNGTLSSGDIILR